MHRVQKLLQALNDKGKIENRFPGIAGLIDGRIIKFGSELEIKDKFGKNIIKNDIAQKIEKVEESFCEAITLSLTDKNTVADLYESFIAEYMKMLHGLNEKVSKIDQENCIWVNSKPCIDSVNLCDKINEDFAVWQDNVNMVSYFVSAQENTQKEELTITFHLTAWRCFSPTQQQKIAMEAQRELQEQQKAAAEREKLIQENNKAVVEKRKAKKEKKMKVVKDAERENVADSIAKENAKNGVAPVE